MKPVARINFFLLCLLLTISLITYRLFNLTYTQHSAFVKSAQSQYNNPSALLAGRGNIYFSDPSSNKGKILAATNKPSFYIYSNNKSVDSPHDEALKLGAILNKDSSGLEAQLSDKNKTYNVISEGLNKGQADQVKALKLKGISVANEIARFYTQGTLAAPVLGFVGFDGNQRTGQYGIESYYDSVLSGEKRTLSIFGNKTYSGLLNFFSFLNKQKDTPKASENSDGSDVVLTIDKNIQSLVEVKLGILLKKWSAASGTIIVEDPNSGEILALASSPSFDPNNYADYKLGDFLNPNVQQIFEPGSSFKPITMSAAVDTGVVTPDTTYTDTGEARFGTYIIKNFDEKAHGVQTMRQVLEHSLNTGAMFAQDKTGDDKFLNYVVGFGFGQKTGVDLSGEISGNITNLYSGRKINFATASYGQGIAVTPLQLVNAFSAIANGGKLMWPHLVKEIINFDGTEVATKPKVIGSPITEKTSQQLKSMLVDVVDKGFDKARISGYDVAGKTGTAQIPDGKGHYLDNNQFVHDFVGFAPAYSPRFVILIKMDKPKGITFASDSLSPMFGDIARFLIRYFNLPPTRQ